jgi:hypothetical protein
LHVATAQAPFTQVAVPLATVQALLQVPQLLMSFVVLTHVPLQPVWPLAQQTLPVQLPETHWLLPAQAVPLASLAAQTPAKQASPGMQSLSVMQVLRHAVPAVLHT